MKASIDIGTNTALLLVAELRDGKFEVIYEEQRVPRLGQGVDNSKHLSKEAMERVIRALKEYRGIISREYTSVDSIAVTATSAVRDAQNRDEFLDTVEDKTGLQVQVLSGYEEALYTFLGAKTVLDDSPGTPNVVIDIGGGSTEIAVGDRKITDRYSFNMGCVRFTERFLTDDPPTDAQLDACKGQIRKTLGEYEFSFDKGSSLVGVAGTVTSLAYIDKGLTTYTSHSVNNHILPIKTIRNYISHFQQLPSLKLAREYPEVMEGRADIFLAGLLILEGFMQRYDFKELVTSTGGIRHGVILDNQ